METTRTLGGASRQVWYELRCYWCEVLIDWAMRMCPKGYVPSVIEAVIDARAGFDGRAASGHG